MESLSDLVEFALLGLGGGQICEILLSMMMMMMMMDLGVIQVVDVLVLRTSIIIILSTMVLNQSVYITITRSLCSFTKYQFV